MAMTSTDSRQPAKPVVGDVGCDYTLNTAHEFKVGGHFEEQEEAGPFSEKSDPIVTKSSGTTESHDKFEKPVTNEAGEGKTSTKPGKPEDTDIGSDFICLSWEKPESKNVLYYEVKYKSVKESLWKKDSISTKDDKPIVRIGGLFQEEKYVFKVRAQFENSEGEFSDESFPIQTKPSLSTYLLPLCTKVEDGEPSVYKLPLSEIKASRNDQYRTRKCEFRSSSENTLEEKTILMVGETGSGKSTLIDRMINYLLDVKWGDHFRFKIIDSIMADAQEKNRTEADTQTDWITSYKIHPKNSTLRYVLNVIDTPGFGDTRGIERDQQLVEQIKHFFTTKGEQGIETVDAIGFVTRASQPRLTQTQKYIFDSILSIFGKNMIDNIVPMITFADGKEPPVLSVLSSANIPCDKYFVFNNSSLFESKTEQNSLSKVFWDMGSSSYTDFFKFILTLTTQSLQVTAEILKKRSEMKEIMQDLMLHVNKGLESFDEMIKERKLVEQFEWEINDNKNFKYTVKEKQCERIPLEPGEYVTNCLHCHMTCHYPCPIPLTRDKHRCSAMNSDGTCHECPAHCDWTMHESDDYRLKYKEVEVEKTYEDMKKKYELGQEKISKQKLVEEIKKKFNEEKDIVCEMLKRLRECTNFLRENAMKANPLTEVEYLDMLIETEKQDKKPGFNERIEKLNMLKTTG